MSAIQEYLDSLQEKTITVIGMGVSNTPLIRMLLRAGLKVTVRDKAPRERSEELAGELESLGLTVQIENHPVSLALVAENVGLSRRVLLHRVVVVQVVGGQVGEYRDIGALVHRHQLERGQLQYRVEQYPGKPGSSAFGPY